MSQTAALFGRQRFFNDDSKDLTVVGDNRPQRSYPFRSACPPLQRIQDVLEAIIDVVRCQRSRRQIQPDRDFEPVARIVASARAALSLLDRRMDLTTPGVAWSTVGWNADVELEGTFGHEPTNSLLLEATEA